MMTMCVTECVCWTKWFFRTLLCMLQYAVLGRGQHRLIERSFPWNTQPFLSDSSGYLLDIIIHTISWFHCFLSIAIVHTNIHMQLATTLEFSWLIRFAHAFTNLDLWYRQWNKIRLKLSALTKYHCIYWFWTKRINSAPSSTVHSVHISVQRPSDHTHKVIVLGAQMHCCRGSDQ